MLPVLMWIRPSDFTCLSEWFWKTLWVHVKNLATTDINYSQIEKKALSLAFAVKKYLYGHEFILYYTDDKPLVLTMILVKERNTTIGSCLDTEMSINCQHTSTRFRFVPLKLMPMMMMQYYTFHCRAQILKDNQRLIFSVLKLSGTTQKSDWKWSNIEQKRWCTLTQKL